MSEGTPEIPGVLRRSMGSMLLYFSSQIGAKVLGFCYFLLLARWLDVAAFGILTYAAALAVLADTVADLGMGRVVLREASRAPEPAARLAGVFVPAKFLISLAIFALIVISLPPRYKETGPLIIFAIYCVWVATSSVAILLQQILHARGSFGYASSAHFIPSVVQIAAGVAVYAAGGGAPAFAGATAFSSVAYLAIILAGLRRLGIGITPGFRPIACLSALRDAVPFAAVSILLLLSLKVEFLILGRIEEAEPVGWYAIAARIYEAALTAPIAFCTVLTPRIIRTLEQGTAALETLYAQSVRVLSLGGAAAALVGVIAVGPLIELLLPERYAPTETLLVLMLLASPFLAVHLLNASSMLVLSVQRGPGMLMGGVVAVQALIAFTLISFAGAPGAATAMLGSAAVACVASSMAIRSWLNMRQVYLRPCAPAAAGGLVGGLMFLATRDLPDAGFSDILALIAAGLTMAVVTRYLPLTVTVTTT